MSYAVATEVSVEKSQAEIQRMLTRAGATKFMTGFDDAQAMMMFVLRSRTFKFVLPLPDRKSDEFQKRRVTAYSSRKATPEEAYKKWEQACRSRWRCLALAIKAKLEAVAIGLTTFEQEFLAFIMTDDGRTVGERIIPQLEDATASGKAPTFLLTMGSQG